MRGSTAGGVPVKILPKPMTGPIAFEAAILEMGNLSPFSLELLEEI
ncbi:uncharacterized protein DNG_00268 [Cephalotrichum gorgonifer]|uniref:Uncharacterized protein n=1 Tax=Cephalotrichum gorgonifer TaxID=2041049 RepID=A0AAE8MPN6_9PEZI|nr:uncharacterized protein DNG_00268 [Cephalotrichum gorgonifer]